MMPLGVMRMERASVEELAAMSRDALDRPLEGDAELLVGEPADEAIVLGAFQRRSEIAEQSGAMRIVRRGSGGAEAVVGPGTLWLQLSLARPDALVACEPSRLLNRYVRPLLRALAKVGALAHYFDRDWISASKRPVGMISFAHDATTGRALVEAIVGVHTPFALRPRASYLGKAPATLAELGVRVDVAQLADATATAYASAYGRVAIARVKSAVSERPGQAALDAHRGMLDAPSSGLDEPRATPDAPDEREAPWAATRDEAIGAVAAGRDASGAMRVGGELMASRDAIRRLEMRLRTVAGMDADAIGRALDETLGAPGVALLGVRSLVSLRDAIVEAAGAAQ
jgi:hypothetical protein